MGNSCLCRITGNTLKRELPLLRFAVFLLARDRVVSVLLLLQAFVWNIDGSGGMANRRRASAFSRNGQRMAEAIYSLK